jgi:hypothetical protein
MRIIIIMMMEMPVKKEERSQRHHKKEWVILFSPAFSLNTTDTHNKTRRHIRHMSRGRCHRLEFQLFVCSVVMTQD